MSFNTFDYLAPNQDQSTDIFRGFRETGGVELVDARGNEVITGEAAREMGGRITLETLDEHDVVLILEILSQSEHFRGKIALVMHSFVRALVTPGDVVKLLIPRDQEGVLRIVSENKGTCTYRGQNPFVRL